VRGGWLPDRVRRCRTSRGFSTILRSGRIEMERSESALSRGGRTARPAGRCRPQHCSRDMGMGGPNNFFLWREPRAPVFEICAGRLAAAPRPRISATRKPAKMFRPEVGSPHERRRPFHRSIRCKPGAMDLWTRDRPPQGFDDARDRAAWRGSAASGVNGRRRSIIPPRAEREEETALPPASRLRLDVLLPGSGTVPYRQNSTQGNS